MVVVNSNNEIEVNINVSKVATMRIHEEDIPLMQTVYVTFTDENDSNIHLGVVSNFEPRQVTFFETTQIRRKSLFDYENYTKGKVTLYNLAFLPILEVARKSGFV